jgi:anti-anti-sigma factor
VDSGAARASPAVFDIEVEGETIIVTPAEDLGELGFQQIGADGKEVLALLERSPARNVVVDFRRTDYYGSTALGFFVRLWKRVRGRNGRMAFCNVSAHEKEILRVAKLDQLWPVCSTREEALVAVRE